MFNQQKAKVGASFQSLLTLYPNIEVHRSESASRVYAFHDNLAYCQDFLSYDYNLNRMSIPISEIIVQLEIIKWMPKNNL